MVQTTLIIKNEKIVNKWGFLLKKYKGDSVKDCASTLSCNIHAPNILVKSAKYCLCS